MNRKVVVVGMSVAMMMALIGLPAGAQPAAKASVAPKVARIAPAGGIMTKARLQAAAGSVSASPDAWRNLPAMQTAVEETGGGAYAGNRGYVPGGLTAAGTWFDKMQIWTGTGWATDPELMPVAVELGVGWGDAAICADTSGKVHVVNGVDGSFLYSAHQVYDPAAPAGSRWSFASAPALATGETYYSQGSGCAFLGGRLFLFGGYAVVDPNPAAELTRVTWMWNPATDTWTDTTRLMGAGRLWFAYTNNPQVAYASGGAGDLTTYNPVEAVEKFSPTTGWSNVAPIPAPAGGGRLAGGMGTIASFVFVFSGGSQNQQGQFVLESETLYCSGACAQWAQLPPAWNAITPRWFNAWFSGGNKVYSAGGNDGTTTIAAAERMP